MSTPILALNRREQTLIGAVADAFFPPGGPIPVSGTEAGLVPYFDRYIERSGTRTAFLMRLLIMFTDLSPIAFGGGWKRFPQLSRAQQIQHLHEASTSAIYFRRVSFVSLRALMTMAYLSNDEVARHMNMKHDADPFGMGELDDVERSGERPKVNTSGLKTEVA
jgi:hypothetical protein